MRHVLFAALFLAGCAVSPVPTVANAPLAPSSAPRPPARLADEETAARAKAVSAPTAGRGYAPYTPAQPVRPPHDGKLVGVAVRAAPGELQFGSLAGVRVCSADGKRALLDATITLPFPAHGIVATRGGRSTYVLAVMVVPTQPELSDHVLVALDERGKVRAQKVFARTATSYFFAGSIAATEAHVAVHLNEPTAEDDDRSALRVFRTSDLGEIASVPGGSFAEHSLERPPPRLATDGDTLYLVAPGFPKRREPSTGGERRYVEEPLVVSRYTLPGLRLVAATAVPAHDSGEASLTLERDTLRLESGAERLLIDRDLARATVLGDDDAEIVRPVCELSAVSSGKGKGGKK